MEEEAEREHTPHVGVDLRDARRAAEDLTGDRARVVEVGRAEEDAAEDHELEGQHDLEHVRPARVGARPAAALAVVAPGPGGDDRERLEVAVDHEGPAGAMPEADEEERDPQVDVGARRPLPRAAEREIEVVTQPGAERHVPAPPEVADARGLVGAVEVLGQLEAEELGRAARDVGVAAEVAVDLEREAVERDDDLGRAERGGVVEHAVDQVHAHEVREDDLLRHAHRDQEERVPDPLAGQPRRPVDLRQELGRAHDRAGDELREEGDVEAEADEAAARLEPPAVDVDRVAERLERVEADADGQQDVEDGRIELHPEQREDVPRRGAEEVEVLEDAEEAEVAAEADQQPSLLARLRLRAGDLEAGREVEERGEEDQPDVGRVPRHVEGAAGEEEEEQPRPRAAHGEPAVSLPGGSLLADLVALAAQPPRGPEAAQRQREEDEVVEAVEEHRRVGRF